MHWTTATTGTPCKRTLLGKTRCLLNSLADLCEVRSQKMKPVNAVPTGGPSALPALIGDAQKALSMQDATGLCARAAFVQLGSRGAEARRPSLLWRSSNST